ncbi:NgoFVII family restriction endonuclease, partial [Alphaproteobacteria bacterium]|nr:NgoFVII family restriction endonuclease [Alphaproteobacteria bacterium]
MLITNEDNSLSFRNAFEKSLKGSDSIKIASGYIGASEIIKYQEQFCEISKKGGIVQIIHGMGGVEGIRSSL